MASSASSPSTRSSCAELRRARPAMGTLLQITASGPEQEAVARAMEEALAAVERVERLMSFHAQDSELSRINRHASREPVAVDAWTYAVLRRAVHIATLSSGVFDVAVAPALVELGVLPRLDGALPTGANWCS